MRPTATESLYKDLESEHGLHDYELPVSMAIRPLGLSDLAEVLKLEESAFPEAERATEEKLRYRLTVCPELCLGVVVRKFDYKSKAVDESLGVAAHSTSITSEKLVAHIIATKTDSEFVTDQSMEAPGGHIETGRTIAVHSLAVDEEHRHKHIGFMMLKDYVQRFFSLGNADGIALLAHERLVPFYKKHGFHDYGPSEATFGGGDWLNLRLPFDGYDSRHD